jgi:ribosomal protein S18 acetylase RimI-like enzyme
VSSAPRQQSSNPPRAGLRPRSVDVSAARPEEYAALGRLTVDAYATTAPPVRDDYRGTLADVAGRAADPDRVVLAARIGTTGGLRGARLPLDGERPVGGVTVVLAARASVNALPDGVAELRMLAVDPAAQGRGVGRALVEAAIALARERGMSKLWLDTQAHMLAAQHIYVSMGFVRVPGRDRDIAGTDIRLLAYELAL